MKLELFDKSTDFSVGFLKSNVTPTIPDNTYVVATPTASTKTSKVSFLLDTTHSKVSTSSPFYFMWHPKPGPHVLSVITYNKKGKASVPTNIPFVVTGSTSPPSPPVLPSPPSSPPPSGDKPSAINTGVLNPGLLRDYRGLLTLDEAGAVYENLNILGRVETRGDGIITLRNSRVTINEYGRDGIQNYLYDDDNRGKNLLVLENVEIFAANPGLGWTTGIAGGTFRASRAYIHHVHDGLRPGDYSSLEDSYMHDLGYGGGGHSDGIQIVNDVWGVHVLHSFIDASFNTRAINGVNTDWVVSNNWLYGLSGTLGFKPSAQRITLTNNKFGGPGRPFYNDPPSQGLKMSGNVWESTGAPV